MTDEQKVQLLPCPWCGNALVERRNRMNPYASCETAGCFMQRCPVVNLDYAPDIEAWNTRQAALSHASATAEECSVVGEAIRADDIVRLLPGPYYMDPPDGGDVLLIEQLRRMAKDASRYRRVRSSCGEFVHYAGGGSHHLLEDDELDRAVDKAEVIDQAIAGKRGG